MRLLIFSTEFPPGPGGIGTHAWQLARNLVRLEWQVSVLTLQDYASAPEIEAFNNQQPFQVHTLNHKLKASQEVFHRIFSLRRLVGDWRPDVLIATGEQAVIVAAAAWLKIPSVVIWHGAIPTIAWQKPIYRWAYQHADEIVAVSQYSYTQMLEMGIQPRQKWVITNGADADQFRPLSHAQTNHFRQEIGLPDQLLLLTVGNVSERKGQDIVIRALPAIVAQKPEAHYLIAGLPTRQAELTKLAEDLGVAKHVHLLGQVDQEQLPIIYNASDVFVLTSRHSSDGEFEGFGIAAVEAALCGKPAVVANNSGLMEAVRDGETGLVVPENDPQAVAQALLSLLSDTPYRERMGQAARARAQRSQTWEICMQQYDAMLRKLAQPKQITGLR